MEFFTNYISFLNDISREKLEFRELITLHADLPDAQIREIDVWKIEKYVTHIPLHETYSNLLEWKAQ